MEIQSPLAIWTLIVFLGLLLVLGKFAWKPLMKALDEREAHLEHVLLDSERARNEAEALVAQHRRELAQAADQVRSRLMEEARREAIQASADSILRRAQAEAEAARERAEREITNARDQALMEIWSKTADLAVSVAGRVLTKELNESDHRRLLEVALGELPANGAEIRGPAPHERPRPPADPVAGTVFEDVAPELTRNYADALLNASGDQVDAVVEELEAIRSDVLGAQPRFAAILASDSISIDEKDRIVTETFEGRALPTVVRFLRVLNRHGRLGLLSSATQQARATLDRRQNRKPVTVRSAIALDEGQQSALRDRLASMTQATPVITLVVDPSLIGGLVVQVGDEVYDASVRTRLEAIRGRLIERKTHEIQSRRDHFSYPA